MSEVLLDFHLKRCVADAFQAGDADDRGAKIRELLRIYHDMRAK